MGACINFMKSWKALSDLHDALSPAGDRRGSCVHLGENLPTGRTEPRATCPGPKGIRVGPSAGKVAFLHRRQPPLPLSPLTRASVISYFARKEQAY